METAAQPAELTPPEAARADIESPWRLFWRRLRQQRLALTGGVILCVLYAMSLLAGFIAPVSYETMDRERLFHPPTGFGFVGWHLAVKRYEQPPDSTHYRAVPGDLAPVHWFVRGEKYPLLLLFPCRVHLFGGDPKHPIYLFGTDEFGRDIFTRVLYGSQISLSVGLVGIVITFGLGMLVGAFSGYFGGWTDDAIMRFCELIMSVPGLYLILALRAAFPPTLKSSMVYLIIMVILSFVRWAGAARVLRGMVLSLRERQFVLAARTLGQSNWRIITRHLLPSTFSYVIVAATLSVPYYILGEVTLSFLGVGIQEPQASWGNMLTAAQDSSYLVNYPWLLAPGAAIFITVLAFNFLGDGLRDAVDAKST